MIKTYLVLTLAVCSVSFAGVLVRLAETHPFVVVFYRTLFALIILLPFSLPNIIQNYRQKHLSSALLGRIVIMGIVFALHLFFWIFGLGLTNVANATIAFSSNPLFTAVGAYIFLQEKVNRYVILAIILGILGVTVLGSGDFSLSRKYFLGDMLALIGGIMFAAYFIIGKPLRKEAHLDNMALMSMVYAVTCLFTTLLILIGGYSLWPISIKSLSALLACTIFPTILGHVLLIYVLRVLPAGVVSAATFAEPIIGGAAAYFIFNEGFSARVWIGYVVIVAGLSSLIYAERVKIKARKNNW